MLDFAKYADPSLDLDWDGVEVSLRNQRALVLGFSGKKGSGKDTFGMSFQGKMDRRLGLPTAQIAFADSLKREATEVIEVVRAIWSAPLGSRAAMTGDLRAAFALTSDQASDIIEALQGEPDDSTGWTRSPKVWWLLRYLGTEVRQSQDVDYWVKKAFVEIARNAASGISTVITDVRFLHETRFIHAINGYLVRIDVSPETQQRRLMGRDNIQANIEALQHPSETQLDDYEGFHQRVDNNADGHLETVLEIAFLRWRNHLEDSQQGYEKFPKTQPISIIAK